MNNDFLKVMIVDDEPLVRDLLEKCVNWGELGIEIVGKAASAFQAIDLLDKLTPDIVFTDICMPSMDGIELAETILEKYPRTKVVIITGYEDFEYAQRSIKAGVKDFILKPINDEEITKVALKIKGEIENERVHFSDYNLIKKQLRENLPYLKEKFLNELLMSGLDGKKINDKLDFYNLCVPDTDIQIILVEVNEDAKENSQEEWLAWRMRCQKVTEEKMTGSAWAVFLDSHHRTVVVYQNAREDLNNDCLQLKKKLIHELPVAVCIGVGNRYSGFEKLHLSYQEACYALKYKVLLGRNEVIFYQDIDFSVSERQTFFDDQMEMFFFYLKAGMKEPVMELLEQSLSKHMLTTGLSINQLRVVASNMISIIVNTLTESGIELSQVFGHEQHPYDKVFQINDLPEMHGYLEDVINATVQGITQLRHKRINNVVQDIQNYLIAHFEDQSLSLSSVAKKFYLNPSYLSRVFRQETGQTFVEYLTEIRMEKAKKLIQTTDLKAYQVAEKVGIIDPHYFGLCFKKYTGLSVFDYKRGQQI